MQNNNKTIIEVGDEVEILVSVNPLLIGKVFKVSDIDKDDLGLEGIYTNYLHYIDKYNVKLIKKKETKVLSFELSTDGANCKKCGKYNEYQTQPFICFECKNV